MIQNDALDLLRYSLSGGEIPNITDWSSVKNELTKQAVLPVVYGIALDAPSETINAIQASYYRNVRNQLMLEQAVRELNETLSPGLPVILKGFASAQYYPASAQRIIGDIDFLVYGIDFDEAVDRLKANGYIPDDEEKSELTYQRHLAYNKNGVRFEMHRYFSHGVNDHDKILDGLILSAAPVESKIDDFTFYSLPPAENGLVLLEHIEHHIQNGIGLRQIIDWACYLTSVMTNRLWSSTFADLCEKTGLTQLAIHMTRLCELYLGAPSFEYAKQADDDIASLIMEEILDAGNFGRGRDQTAGKIASFRNSGNIFKRLQNGGLSNWKYTWTHKWARPFAWIYQIFHILRLLVRKKNRNASFGKADTIAKRQDTIRRALHIGKYENNQQS